MWLGFAAAFIGILYALLKFLTMFHLRRLKEDIIVAQHEVQKNHQRLERLHEKLAVAQSKKRTLQRDNVDIHRVAQQLYVQLRTILPTLSEWQRRDAADPTRSQELQNRFQKVDDALLRLNHTQM